MRKKFLFTSLLISLLPVLLLSFYFYRWVQYSTRENMVKELRKEVDLTHEQYLQFIREKYNNIVLLSQLSLLRVTLEFQRPEELSKFLDSFIFRYKTYDAILVFDQNKQFFAINSHDSNEQLLNRSLDSLLAILPSFKETMKTLANSRSAGLILWKKGVNSPAQDLYIAAKIKGLTDQNIGYIIARIPSDAFQEMASQIRVRMDKYSFRSLQIAFSQIKNPSQNGEFPYCSKGELGNHIAGQALPLCLDLDESELTHPYGKYTVFLVGTILFLLVFFSYIFNKLIQSILNPLKKLMDNLERVSRDDFNFVKCDSRYPEVISLTEKANEITKKMKNYSDEIKEKAKALAQAKMATQVAHDIRSPLSSMKTALEFFGKLQNPNKHYGDYLNLLELSANRLSSIADSLLKSHQQPKVQTNSFSPHKILDELVGEYQNQSSFKNVQFIKKYHLQDFNLEGEPAKLQRAFGNIIKNAVEAVNSRGKITITTKLENSMVIISISDAGPGMSSEKLKKVLEGGYTEGKKEGHGIGMTVVREAIAEYGGTLEGISVEGQGTTFIIKILLSAKQSLNAQKMTLYSFAEEPVVVIDDDPSMREQWRLSLKKEGKEVILCTSYEDFAGQNISAQISKTAVVDYHFDNSELNGGDIIQKLKEKGFAYLYLCTAEYWKPSVQKLAQELKIAICPKPLPKIALEISSSSPPQNGYNILVIDDDPLIGITWKALCDKMNIGKLHFYPNFELLLQSHEEKNLDFASLDFAFLDKNMEGSKYGVNTIADYLKSNKVKRIILATGDHVKNTSEFPAVDHISKRKIPDTLEIFL